MSFTWDNPMSYNFIATRQCRACDRDHVSKLWSRPWEFAGEAFASCLTEVPLTMPEVASMLRDAPFECKMCGGREARLVGMALGESEILF